MDVISNTKISLANSLVSRTSTNSLRNKLTDHGKLMNDFYNLVPHNKYYGFLSVKKYGYYKSVSKSGSATMRVQKYFRFNDSYNIVIKLTISDKEGTKIKVISLNYSPEKASVRVDGRTAAEQKTSINTINKLIDKGLIIANEDSSPSKASFPWGPLSDIKPEALTLLKKIINHKK